MIGEAPGINPIGVGRLTIRRRGMQRQDNQAVLRLHAQQWLDACDLRLPGVSSGIVLIVRRVDALPALRAGAALPGRKWQVSLTNRLAELYARAARPARSPVGPDAESVVFDDMAQLLAVFTSDLLARLAYQRWYWQQWLRAVPSLHIGAVLSHVWSTQARSLPAALGQMPFDTLCEAVSCLSQGELGQVARALHDAFSVPSAVLHVALPAGGVTAEDVGEVPPDPPWQQFWPPGERALASISELSPQVQYVAGLGLTLHHIPAFARSETFATQAARWLAAALRAREQPQAHIASLRQRGAILGSLQADWPAQTEKDPDLPNRVAPPAPVNSVAMETNSRGEQQDSEPESSAVMELPDAANAPEPPPLQDDVRESLSTSLPPAIWTALGGVLYLVNLLIWLDLPGMWRKAVGGWAIVEALARGLLGEAGVGHADDPLWSILADLDERAVGVPAGARFPIQSEFRLPAAWLRRERRAERHWVAWESAGRLIVVDEAVGYVVANVMLAGHLPGEVAQDVVDSYAAEGIAASYRLAAEGSEILTGTLSDDVRAMLSPGLAGWLVHAQTFVCALLAQMLGDPAMSSAAIAGNLLTVPAQIVVSWTHIDLFVSSENARIPIRQAGLDRDPGWVPDLGYIVLFHFGQWQ